MTEKWSKEESEQAREDGAYPQVRAHPLFDGVQIIDPIEGSQFTLLTPTSVEPTAIDLDEFYFPVDTAATICTNELETPYLVDIWIRDAEGELVAQSTDEGSISVPPGEYNLEVSSAQMKLYIAVNGRVQVATGEDRVRLDFGETECISIGVRSLHEQPAATITTTDDPEDLMAAISAFGSALKTTSCERSFPTLRGHPPLLERGTELDIPDVLDVPETGIRIEVPPEREYIYPIASLAYYLGATVVPGDRPRLHADGETFSLTADGDFESTVARVLEQVFLMDCVTRTEGYYTVDLHERNVVEDAVDLDFEALYERSTAEQVRTYLSIPFEDVTDAVPRWKLTADVVPDPEHAETLPFLANDLAKIRTLSDAEIRSRSVHEGLATVEDFFGRGSKSARSALTRSTRTYRSDSSGPFEEHVFRPPESDSIEQAYVGEGVPIRASKLSVEAFNRRLRYQPSEDARTEVIVVSNEEEMADESVVSEIYGTREWIDFDITIRHELTTDEMRDVLATDADFFHYIGHVDEEGIRCSDGWLDTRTLDEVGVSAFLLNACKSYEQGRALVEKGAIGGIVTVADLLNKTATKLGRTIAFLSDAGFSLSTSLELLERQSIVSNHYLIVGDGNMQVVESQTGSPYLAKLEDDNEFKIQYEFYPSRNYGPETLVTPRVKGYTTRYLTGNRTRWYQLSMNSLEDFIQKHGFPIEYNGSIYWSEDFPMERLD
ncbi:hypothetical protein [Halapricum hydrolyticum]|uniref:CHAT domain-containing protein n=1 Tax=Halapricum hydrolyticum TaxID=2979991 RepID=A0AAE3IAI9_9EURY|nr:hypothetical protein [Halapricum hydrolyticum]MCU4718355.1 hypothetical protein [Halapricum hydrolyticum]MCU4726532.1 hypothetical protein [Halapricum hydrolyticum]